MSNENTSKKVWGIILIVIGVIATIYGVLVLVGINEQSAQIEAIQQLGGKAFQGFGDIAQKNITDGYLKAFFVFMVGVLSAFIGTKMLSTSKKDNV